jgi:CheY-like chemotaxis protein
MTKILLVEDDKSLREIYGVRLLAEGYDIVSAGDGEEALAMAIKERPSLIITDVMMPKISGFDMLDILRSTTETKNIKVIMMTALGSDENKARSERLGADRYLVKSQVGIEDVIHVVHDVLQDQQATATTPAAPAAPTPMPQPTPPPVSTPPVPQPSVAPQQPVPAPRTIPTPPAPQPSIPVTPPSAPSAPPPPTPPVSHAESPVSTRGTRVIQPINDPSQRLDIQSLLDKELAKEADAGGVATPVSTPPVPPPPPTPQEPSITGLGPAPSMPPMPPANVAPPRGVPSAPVTPDLPPVTPPTQPVQPQVAVSPPPPDQPPTFGF